MQSEQNYFIDTELIQVMYTESIYKRLVLLVGNHKTLELS